MKKILNEYREYKTINKQFLKSLNLLVTDIISQTDLAVNTINTRMKSVKSLKRKLVTKPYKYESINDITDICGLRIITYFENDVDKIGEIIQNNFSIDEKNSVDKRIIIEPDRFGYLSLHYVVKFNDNILSLPENRIFKNCVAEIQIRSILQHAWAQIEHDLGYKSNHEVPKHIRRQFARIAGLLELADDQFNFIKNQLNEYEHKINHSMESEGSNIILIDKITVENFLKESKLILKLDKKIKEQTNGVLKDYYTNYSSLGVDILKFFNFENISQVEKSIKENFEQIINFASEWIEEDEPILYRGISIVYFGYVKATSEENDDYLNSYLDAINAGGDSMKQNLIKVYKKIASQ